MPPRLALIFLIASATLVVTQPVQAHPEEYQQPMPAVEATMPTTCAELAARTPQPGDANNAELKALKAKCEAEKATKPSTPLPLKKKD